MKIFGKEEQLVLLDGTPDQAAVLIAVVVRAQLPTGIIQKRVRVQILVFEVTVGFAVETVGALLEHHGDAGGIAELGVQGATGNSKFLQGIGGRQRDQAEAVGAGSSAIGSVL